jgi:hypothetical protein
MRIARVRLLLLVGVLLASAGAAEARSQGISTGLYTCYTYTHFYSGAIRLTADGRYAYSYATTGGNPPKELAKPRWGRYRVSGNRLTLTGGPWGSKYGVIKTSRKVTIYEKGGRYPYTWCNWRAR